ncbi:MAG: response regulator [Gemmatimonadetes bacterium]|nr:response regulator [Gemmatimonadota bacterium]
MAKILLVDDEFAVRELLAEVLELDAHLVTQADDGASAIAAVERELFDLVVTDLVMPDKEGIETIMEIRQRWPALKIIAMSGGGRGDAADYLDMAASLGAAATLQKPFSSQLLLDTVAQVLATPPADSPSSPR